MERETFRPEGVAIPAAPYSSVVASGDLVFTAGQVGQDASGKVVSDDFAEQARQVFDNLGRCLAAAGCGLGDVVKVTTFLADLADAPAYNEIYQQHFEAPYPARSTVGAPLIGDYLIEVEAIARRPA